MALVDPRLHNVPDESDGGVNNLERDACDNTSIIASFDQTESQGQNARESVPIAAISITDDAAEGPGSDVLPRLRTSTDGSCEIPIAGVVDTSDSPIQYADATIAVVPENLRQLIFWLIKTELSTWTLRLNQSSFEQGVSMPFRS